MMWYLQIGGVRCHDVVPSDRRGRIGGVRCHDVVQIGGVRFMMWYIRIGGGQVS